MTKKRETPAFDEAKERERRIQQHMRDCIHFTGIQKGTCKAGVNYREVVGGDDFGWATRLPCIAGTVGASCPQQRMTTREEAEAAVKASDASLNRLRTCMVAIRAKHGTARGLADSMPCPTGCGGTLGYTIAGSNGHIWGKCSTVGCAAWMQ